MKPIYTCGAEPNRAVYVGNERVLPPYLREDLSVMTEEDKEKIYVGWGNEDMHGETLVKRVVRTSPPEGWCIGPFSDHLSAQQWIDNRTHMEKGKRFWGTGGMNFKPRRNGSGKLSARSGKKSSAGKRPTVKRANTASR